MKDGLQYNYSDILSVPGAALKAKKIFVTSLSLLAGLIIYGIFSYLALIIEGYSITGIFANCGLLPLSELPLNSTIGEIFYYVGVFLSLFSVLSGMSAVAVMDLENFRGNPFCTILQALKFSRSRAKQLFMSFLTIVLFVLFIILLGAATGLIARIPYLGDLLYSVMFFFPNFIISLMTLVVIFVLMAGILLMPPAVAADRAGETFNSILGTFSTIIRQPVRWIIYTLYSFICAKIAGFIFACFCFGGLWFMKFITGLGGGEKTDIMISSGLSHLPLKSIPVEFTFNLIPGANFGIDVSTLAGSTINGDIFSYVTAFSLFLVFLTIWGYIISIVATGQTYAYAIIRKFREGYDTTEEEAIYN